MKRIDSSEEFRGRGRVRIFRATAVRFPHHRTAAEAIMAQKNVEGSQQSESGRPQPGESTPRQTGEKQQGTRQSGALQRRSFAPLVGSSGFSPFSFARRMMEDMDRMFEGFGPRAGISGWMPAVDVLERNARIVVRADLPGLSPDDVRIDVRGGSLVLEGERKSESEGEEGGVYRSERTYGRFSREIPLPEEADVDNAQARFENGVLEIEVPLREESSRRRRIEIRGGSKQGQGPVH